MNFAHTDYFKYFIHFSKKKNSTNHKKCLLYMLNDLKIISNDKLIIPTYNYSFGEKKYKVISVAVIIIMFWPIMSTGSLIKNWYGVSTFFIVGICMCLSKFRNNY